VAVGGCGGSVGLSYRRRMASKRAAESSLCFPFSVFTTPNQACFSLVQYGNPHSRTHMYGWESEDAVEKARQQVSQELAARKRCTSFAS